MSDTGFADGFADGFVDGDGDVRMRPVAPRRAATAAATAGRAEPRSRTAELAFTTLIHVKALSRSCRCEGEEEDGKPSMGRIESLRTGSAGKKPSLDCMCACISLAAGTLCGRTPKRMPQTQSALS